MIMGRHTSAEIASVIKDSPKEIAETTTWEDVPEQPSNPAVTTRITASFLLKNGLNSSWTRISDDAFERHKYSLIKKKPAFELVPFFYFQNLDLGFFTNGLKNTIFHVSF